MISWRRQHGASVRTERAPRQWAIAWRQWLRWLGVLCAAVAMGAGFHTVGQRLLDPVHFPLRHVQLEGSLRNLNEADIRRLVEGYLGQNFFALDLDAVQRVLAAEPWIERAQVRRQWPDRLVVRFQERTVFARWGEAEMVDVNGRRFRPAVVRQPGPWPVLEGPDGHELTLIRTYREASATVAGVGLTIDRLVQDERRAWWMAFDNGVEVHLGREHFAQRLRRFVEIYPRVLSQRIGRVAAVDLRYINGFAVRWTEGAGPRRGGSKPTAGRAWGSAQGKAVPMGSAG